MEKIKKIRLILKKELIDGYLIPKNDEFFTEYVAENKDRLILKIYTIKPPKRTAALVSRKKTREIFEQETSSEYDSDSDSSSTNKKHKKC